MHPRPSGSTYVGTLGFAACQRIDFVQQIEFLTWLT